MNIYILPDKVEPFMKKVNRMIAHLENKPVIKVSEPFRQKITQVTTINKGWDGRTRECYYLDLVEIEIEDVCQDNWTIVASVFHDEGIVEMMDKDLFKSMPKCYGTQYTTCDYCGRKESRRKHSFVICNMVTGEWKQVGSSCVNKMFNNGKYLANFAIQIYQLVNINFGCCDLDMICGGGWSAPDNYYKQAIDLHDMVYCVCDWRDAGNTRWQKPVYSKYGKEDEGTTFYLNEYFDGWEKKGKNDGEFYAKVAEFVNGLDSEASEFNANIKRAFEAEFIARHEVYIAFFAVKMYLDSLQLPFVERAAQEGFVKGESCYIEAKMIGMDVEYGYYGKVWSIGIRDLRTGFLIIKESSTSSIFDKFTDENGVIRFKSTVGYINERKELIKLSGRLSK